MKKCESCKQVELKDNSDFWIQCEICMMILCGNYIKETCLCDPGPHLLLKEEHGPNEYCEFCHCRVWSNYTHKHCPNCNADPSTHVMKNYSMMWHEGDIYCGKCDTYVRGYDAG